eukprot:SAG11_NODE_2362_length_3460_cov_2.653675_2_plen_191_part_00
MAPPPTVHSRSRASSVSRSVGTSQSGQRVAIGAAMLPMPAMVDDPDDAAQPRFSSLAEEGEEDEEDALERSGEWQSADSQSESEDNVLNPPKAAAATDGPGSSTGHAGTPSVPSREGSEAGGTSDSRSDSGTHSEASHEFLDPQGVSGVDRPAQPHASPSIDHTATGGATASGVSAGGHRGAEDQAWIAE